jgi:hypothetical protein
MKAVTRKYAYLANWTWESVPIKVMYIWVSWIE